jgi:hypothetical protein
MTASVKYSGGLGLTAVSHSDPFTSQIVLPTR